MAVWVQPVSAQQLAGVELAAAGRQERGQRRAPLAGRGLGGGDPLVEHGGVGGGGVGQFQQLGVALHDGEGAGQQRPVRAHRGGDVPGGRFGVVLQRAQVGQLAGEQQALVAGQGVHRQPRHPGRVEPGRDRPAGEQHPGGAGMPGERGQQPAEPRVQPGPRPAEQGLQVVQHEQQPGLLHQLGQPRQVAIQRGVAGDGVDQLQGGQLGPLVGVERRVELGLQGLRQARQRGGPLVGRRGLPERGGGERGVGLVGQLQRAGGLAGPGHAVQQHPGPAAADQQGVPGLGEQRAAADEPGRFGGESGHRQADRQPPGRRRQPQPGGGAEQRRGGQGHRRRPDRRGERGGPRQRPRQRHVDRLAVLEQPSIHLPGELDREVVDHRVAHRQHRAAQPLHQRPPQPRPARRRVGLGGGVGFLVGLGVQRGGLLGQVEQAQGLRGGGRPGLAGREHHQPQPAAHRKQQLDQVGGVQRVGGAVRVLQQQHPGGAVPGQVHDVPAVLVVDRRRQRRPGHPVLQHPQLHRPRLLALPELADQLVQGVALAAQPEHRPAGRRAEQPQQPQRRVVWRRRPAGWPASAGQVEHEPDLLAAQDQPAPGGDLPGPVGQEGELGRHRHPDGDRGLVQQRRQHRLAERLPADPVADLGGELGLADHPPVRVGLPAQEPVQVGEPAVLVVAGRQGDLVRGQRLALLGAQQPPPPQRPGHLQRLQHQPGHDTPRTSDPGCGRTASTASSAADSPPDSPPRRAAEENSVRAVQTCLPSGHISSASPVPALRLSGGRT